MPSEIEFDWDDGNVRHLRGHRVSPEEFEQVILNDPFDLEYQTETGESRYKSFGVTDGGRILIVVWTVRQGRIRAVTAYEATRPYQELFWRLTR